MQPQFNQVAFSGGGIRCFWHGGFLSKVGDFETISPERVTGVSGGALSAASWIGGREQDLYDLMREAFRINESQLALDRSRFTPHEEIYKAVVETTLDADALSRVADGPEFEISLATPPSWCPPILAALLYGAIYQMDQKLRSSPHLILPKRAGLDQLRIDGREAARAGQLIDLICAAATIPPVFKVPEWDGSRVLDGGMREKVLIPDPDEGSTLILLTRRYRNLPDERGRTYVQPSREVAADKIDFTDETKVTRTWEQGEVDGEAWLADWVTA